MLILQFLLAFLAVAVVQTVLYTLFVLRGLDYRRVLSRRGVYEGESIELYEYIQNKSALPLLWLKAESRFDPSLLFTRAGEGRGEGAGDIRISAGAYHRSAFSIPPYRRVKRTYDLICSKRGFYRLGTSTLTTGDMIGFVGKIKTYEFNTELHVYPRQLHFDRLTLPSRSWRGDMVVRRFILPDPFITAGVRDYTPGDPLGAVNWKASAKTGRLAVHRYDFTADANLYVFFNIDCSADQWGAASEEQAEHMENALCLLASVLDRAVYLGQRVALLTNAVGARDGTEVNLPPAYGREQRERLMRALAEIQIKRSRSFHMKLREYSCESGLKNADVLIMSRYFTREMQSEADLLRARGNNVEMLTLPDIPACD